MNETANFLISGDWAVVHHGMNAASGLARRLDIKPQAHFKAVRLQSLADIAIEQGDDSEASLAVSTDAIPEEFIRYSWRQAMRCPAAVDTRVLQQNTNDPEQAGLARPRW